MASDVHARGFLIRDAYRPDDVECASVKGFLKNAPLAKLLKVFGPFVLSIFLGVFLRIYYRECWYWHEQAWVLGDAFLVAGIIGCCIEAWSVSIMIDHAADELSSRLVGYGLPKAAQGLIHKLVLTKRVYRDYRVAYRIEKHPTIDGYVIVHSTASYTVVNNGGAPEPYRAFMAQEGMYKPEATHLEYGEQAFDSAKIKKTVAKTGVVSFVPPDECKEFVLTPSDAGAAIESLTVDQKCFVRWQLWFVMPEYYSDVVAFGGVVVDPTIELISLPENLKFDATEDNCAHEPDGQTWRYQRAFVEGQHVRVWWKPKTEAV